MPAKFERQLGPKFDIRDFHAQVLMTGALPMMIPEQKIDDWIAAKKGVIEVATYLAPKCLNPYQIISH